MVPNAIRVKITVYPNKQVVGLAAIDKFRIFILSIMPRFGKLMLFSLQWLSSADAYSSSSCVNKSSPNQVGQSVPMVVNFAQ